jgi:hypothetical protein
MSRSTLLVVGLGTVLIGGIVCAAANQAQTSKPSVVSVVLDAEHHTVKAGDRVFLRKTLKNQSDHEVTFGREVYHSNCALDVRDSSGSFAADRKAGYRHGRLDLQQLARMTPEQVAKSGLLSGKLAWIRLQPGEAFVETCDASSFYDITKPGVYRIAADAVDPESAVLIKSNTVEVTVVQ